MKPILFLLAAVMGYVADGTGQGAGIRSSENPAGEINQRTKMVTDRTGKKEQLKFVTDRYNELLDSPEYLIFGGVPENFVTVGVSKRVVTGFTSERAKR